MLVVLVAYSLSNPICITVVCEVTWTEILSPCTLVVYI